MDLTFDGGCKKRNIVNTDGNINFFDPIKSTSVQIDIISNANPRISEILFYGCSAGTGLIINFLRQYTSFNFGKSFSVYGHWTQWSPISISSCTREEICYGSDRTRRRTCKFPTSISLSVTCSGSSAEPKTCKTMSSWTCPGE